MKKTKINDSKEKITLKPKDYIVFSGGLKFENVSDENAITLYLPREYTITPIEFKIEEK